MKTVGVVLPPRPLPEDDVPILAAVVVNMVRPVLSFAAVVVMTAMMIWGAYVLGTIAVDIAHQQGAVYDWVDRVAVIE